MKLSTQLKLAAAMLALGAMGAVTAAQSAAPSDLPNPFKTIAHWGQLPDGRMWGSTAGIAYDPKSGNIWGLDRCGGNSCVGSNLDPVVEFDPSGKALKHFGAGEFIFPHGIYVDNDGNVWVTDQLYNQLPRQGAVVVKFSPDGKKLMTLGEKGVHGNDHDHFAAPSAVITGANGDIFVADGHTNCDCENNRIVKFDKNGKYIKEWGTLGSGPGQFDKPHTLAIDSQGRLFVGDRNNNRIEIFDQDGKYITEWKQFGRPSGIYIDKNDLLYVADSESKETKEPSNQGVGYGFNPGSKRGIRVGSAKTGQVMYFIPDPDPKGTSSAAEGVTADAQGNIYGAEVGPKDTKKYVKQ